MCSELPTPPPAFEATAVAGTVVVVLRGEFDLTSAGFLSDRVERVRESGPRRLVFDMSQVGFMDCASARLIAGTSRWLPVGVKPAVRHPSPIVRRVLDISGVSALCELEPSASPED